MLKLARTNTVYYFIVAVQGICTLFFLWDVVLGLMVSVSVVESSLHRYTELAVSLGLITGLILGVLLLQRLQLDRKRAQEQLKIASGAFAEVVEQRFDEWSLTATEREVALFTLKGYSVSEIAGFREKSEGTIKAQSNAIYRKAGVNGRTHLISLFIEDLIDDPVAKT